MKCIFQLMETETGVRSEPIELTVKEFAYFLKEHLIPEQMEHQAILVLMQKQADQEYEFSKAPFMMVETFIEHFTVEQAA